MKGRWIIRGVFIALPALCLIGWAWSAGYRGYVRFAVGGRLIGFEAESGVMIVGFGTARGYPSEYEIIRSNTIRLWPSNVRYRKFRWGFGFTHMLQPDVDLRVIAFPHWAVLLISSILLWMVWRKTRDRRNAARFPVEVQQPV
jgi:hypothetical protein